MSWGWRPWRVVGLVALVLLATWNLTGWPATWFDEGSHLMVPKSVVRYGVYADYDSAGFRYFGATLGVGPTVLLPIAAVFKLFGVGLVQARLVMACYLVLAVVAFHRLARRLAGDGAALIASALLVLAPGVGTLEFGRQVLGEAPGLLFLCLGMAELVIAAGAPRPWRLAGAGALLGLAAVTKYQLLGVVMLGLCLAWLLSWWRRAGSLKAFVIPVLAAGVVFAAWQVCLLGYLGPSSLTDNFRYVRQAAGGAAFALSLERALASGRLLLEPGMLLGALVPAIGYGTALALRRDDQSHGWRILMGFTLGALSWFVVASIGWRRYAYPGLALACLPTGALLVELLRVRDREGRPEPVTALRWAGVWWLAAMMVLPLPVVLPRIFVPRPQEARAMAETLNREVSSGATVATWEPEMTFLTDHRYRVPPQALLSVAVAHVWAGGPSPASRYDFMAGGAPDYVLEGPFARGIGLFPENRLRAAFEPVQSHGPYVLLRRKAGGQ